MNEDDKKLWDAVVRAEQQIIAAQQTFYHKTKSRHSILADALQPLASPQQQRAALAFLEVFGDDVPEVLDPLIVLSTTHTWALASRKAIENGLKCKPEAVKPKLRNIIRSRLANPDMDAEYYRRLAELLWHIGDDEMLAELVESAKAYSAKTSDDPDIKEVIKDFRK